MGLKPNGIIITICDLIIVVALHLISMLNRLSTQCFHDVVIFCLTKNLLYRMALCKQSKAKEKPSIKVKSPKIGNGAYNTKSVYIYTAVCTLALLLFLFFRIQF